MNYLKKIVKSLLISFITILVFMFLFTLLEYIGWISNNTFKIIMTIINIIAFLISGLVFGKKSSKKGWFEGIKLSLIEILILIIINFSLSTTSSKNIILYLIIFLFTTVGSIIGVNKNTNIK